MNLKGWQYIIYLTIKNNFGNEVFELKDIYKFNKYFKNFYPDNNHIKDKIRQVLQQLRDKKLLVFIDVGKYQIIENNISVDTGQDNRQRIVYLLSNDSIKGWLKIGRTNDLDRRMSELFNTSVPLPFKLEDEIIVNNDEESRTVEKSIHTLLDQLNPKLRKMTEAYKREFFKMDISDGKALFNLVKHVMNIRP